MLLVGVMACVAIASAAGKTKEVDGHEAVDLGLSVKWATCNVGAYSPEQYGGFYSWGEVNTKGEYTSATTNGYASGDICGTKKDTAYANWGRKWRMPTKTEMEELLKLCKWEWITKVDFEGYKVTGPNGNFILLPASGYRHGTRQRGKGSSGRYWIGSKYSSCLKFDSTTHNIGKGNYYYGFSVRPVTDK